MGTIHSLLSDPDKLVAMSDSELRAALAPFIPPSRKAVLPEEKPQKVGVQMRAMAEFLKNPALVKEMSAARAARDNQEKK